MIRAGRGMLLVMAKAPEPGRVKTRLAALLGTDGAAALAEALLVDTWRQFAPLPNLDTVLVLSGGPELPPLEPTPKLWSQGDGDLGARMERAFQQALAEAPWAIAIGTDAPGLPVDRVTSAASLLRASDRRTAILGPSEDGGYYLLGVNDCPDGLLSGLPWSSSTTFKETYERLKKRGFSTHELPAWFDVDEPHDVERLRRDLEHGRVRSPATQQALARLGL